MASVNKDKIFKWEYSLEKIDVISWEEWKKKWRIRTLEELEKETDGFTFSYNWEYIYRE
jgi:hypothetical protein